MFSERAQQYFTFIYAVKTALIRAADVSLVADSSQELHVLSFTRSTEFIENNVEQKVHEMGGVRCTVF
jgi:hypothetical protein